MKKKIIFIICFILVFIICLVLGIYFIIKGKDEPDNDKPNNNINNNIDNNLIFKEEYKGEYDYQEFYLKDKYGDEANNYIDLFNDRTVLNYEEYINFCNKWNLDIKYSDNNKNYFIVTYAGMYGKASAKVSNVKEKDDRVYVYLWEHFDENDENIGAYFIVIPVNNNIRYSDIINVFTEEEYEILNSINYEVKKPIIYIYPEEEMNVSIKLDNSSLITVSYPKYNDEWNVVANKDGNLKDIKTNKNYYGLYYEAKRDKVSIKKEGFVIEGKDTVEFLEEKLSILGLNERERNEFIIYWLPRLESNKYNYIRFETLEEINNYMPLTISPKPDSIIRVIMDFKALDSKIKVENQELKQVSRYGYSVVEWGGIEIK